MFYYKCINHYFSLLNNILLKNINKNKILAKYNSLLFLSKKEQNEKIILKKIPFKKMTINK